MQILRYAGRYVRRPLIAEHRILEVTPNEVRFLTKDRRSGWTVGSCYTLDEFAEHRSHHVPKRYANNVRYFGLLAPRTKGRPYDFIFYLMGQRRRRRPDKVALPKALWKYFAVDPMVDIRGQSMRWIGRLDSNSEAGRAVRHTKNGHRYYPPSPDTTPIFEHHI